MKLGALLEGSRRSGKSWRNIEIKGLTADSREVEKGFLFAALAGTRADGAGYAADALTRGAVAILADTNAARRLKTQNTDTPVFSSTNPRRALALMAARFYGAQPDTMVAVTGTNGKTSVASFVRQIWLQAGLKAASIGTVGIVTDKETMPLKHTTPDPVALHRVLSNLATKGITHAALEVSSHGLAQHRADGVRLVAGGFTNISRDHLDYHASFSAYLAHKMRLFSEVLPRGAAAVINADSAQAGKVKRAAARRGLTALTVGETGKFLKLVKHERAVAGQALVIADESGTEHGIHLPLVGDFQASNALVAAGLAIASGLDAATAIAALEHLQGARGRLEMVGETRAGATIFVDYAHTPDALATVLDTLRPYTKRRLIVVFGAGGDRDSGKRPEMGKAAAKLADITIVTDDNPRSEDPAAIRAAIMKAAPAAIEIGDRRTAIAAGVRMLRAGDTLLVAGKGHETGQIVGDTTIPFSDHDAVAGALKEALRRG